MSAGWRVKRARSAVGVSPVRMATVGSWNAIAGGAGGLGDADQRRAQVAFDVDRQGFDGGNVEDAAAFVARRDGREHEAIDAPEKSGEGFAGAGGSEDEGGFAAGDGGPAELLGPRGGGEDGVEPRADGRVEEVERVSGHGSRCDFSWRTHSCVPHQTHLDAWALSRRRRHECRRGTQECVRHGLSFQCFSGNNSSRAGVGGVLGAAVGG